MDAEELTRRRKALGLSRPELAREIDVVPATVWRWEVRGTKPNTVMARHIEQTLRRLERRRPSYGQEQGHE